MLGRKFTYPLRVKKELETRVRKLRKYQSLAVEQHREIWGYAKIELKSP